MRNYIKYLAQWLKHTEAKQVKDHRGGVGGNGHVWLDKKIQLGGGKSLWLRRSGLLL